MPASSALSGRITRRILLSRMPAFLFLFRTPRVSSARDLNTALYANIFTNDANGRNAMLSSQS
jgi:hypothetical protein